MNTEMKDFRQTRRRKKRKEKGNFSIGERIKEDDDQETITCRVERKSPGMRPEIHACARVSRGIIFDAVCIIKSRILVGRREWRLFD